MDSKNRLIKKLLKVAKKHKVLTYPVLALVAVISVISYFFSWSTGAGKRVVAVIMVMVMLISQSYFLTSSATELVDTEESELVQQELQESQNNSSNKNSDQKPEKSENVSSDNNDDKSLVTDSDEASSISDSSDVQTIDNGGLNDSTVEDPSSVDSTSDDITDTNSDITSENEDTADDTVGTDIDSDASMDTSSDDEIVEDDIDSKAAERRITIHYHYSGESGLATLGESSNYSFFTYVDGTSDYNISTLLTNALNELKTNHSSDGCYDFDGWYSDSACSDKVGDTISVGGSTNDIDLYSKRSLVYYKVELDTGSNDVTFTPSITGDGGIYKVPASEGQLVLSSVYRKGYDADIPTVSGGGSGSVNDAKDTVTVSFIDGSSASRKVTLNWSGKKYNIKYADNAGDIVETQEVVYGKSSYTFFDGSVKAAYPEDGWIFDTWYIGSKGGTVVTAISDSVSSYQDELYKEDGTAVVLYPKYKYDGIELFYDGYSSSTHSSGGDNHLYYQYKKKDDKGKILGKYTSKESAGSTHFTYQVVSDGGITGYGFSISADSNGVIISTNGPTKITDSAGLPVTFKIVDSSVTDADTGVSKEKEFTVYVHVSPRVLKIAQPDDNQTVKSYDGTTITYLQSHTLATDDEGGSTVTFSTAAYNSADVATADKILLNGVVINPPTGESASNYVLDNPDEPYISGSITQRPLFIKTTVELSSIDSALGYVRAGEQNPENLGIVEDTSYKSAQIGLLEKDKDILSDLATCFVEPSRDNDLEKETTYYVNATPATDSNYKITVSEKASFNVRKQSPAGLFQYNDGLDDNVWHVGSDVAIIAKNTSGYDTVRISRDGGASFKDGGTLTEEDTKNENLRLMLYDSATGAVTSSVPITVMCDTTAPQYAGYTVEEASYDSGSTTGLYFPGIGSVLDFGTYINSTMTIKIKYTDDTSDLAFLHYGLFGDSANTNTVPFDKTSKTATIKILRSAIDNADTKKGIITCYAEDIAGLTSGETILSPTGKNNSYEFSVEKGAPEVGKLVVYAGKNKSTIVADQTGLAEDKMQYYNHCQASVTVSDSVSGLESIVWHINGNDSTVEIHQKTKVDQPTPFTKDIEGANSEVVTVYATVYDNAGNEKDTNSVTFRLDDVDPNLDVDYDDQLWSKDTTITFTTSDDLSGVDYAKVTDGEGNTIDCDLGKPDSNGVYSASFQALTKGTYSIVVADKAGNTTEWTKDVQKISTSVPDCPVIKITPEEPNGENGWFNADGADVSALITYNTKTEDNTPTTAGYRLWKEGETGYNDTPIENGKITVPINDEGVFNLKAWVDSVSGVHCADYDDHVEKIKIDRTAPDISFSTEKGTGSTVMVHFDITDPISGVNGDSIQVLHGDKNIDITKTSIEDGFSGSFEITETGNYTIKAKDLAGNESDEAAFTPMSMKIKAVSNITDTTATVGANVTKGTFDIKSVVISYRKYSDEKYKEADTVVNYDDSGNAAASAVLSELTPSTSYVYKVTATSDANELLEYEGYFRTLSKDQTGISVIGTARYSDDTKGNITVGLFDGNECMMATQVQAGNEFVFYDVPDGNYSLVATDGTYSKTTRLLIEDGMIVYPTNYIELVLSGKNTSVVITTADTPKITADNMDSIFEDDNVNFTNNDTTLIENGGTVEFKLYATLMTLSSVSSDEISAMYSVTDSKKIVGAYLDLSLYKIVTDANGDVERSRVTNLASPANISVTIPLGELAGKKDLEVVRIHNDGENFIGASLTDQDSNPNTYTITTNQFSTYAVLYSVEGSTTTEQPTTEPTTEPTTQPQQVTPVSTDPVVGQEPSTVDTDHDNTTTTEDDEDDEDIREIKDKKNTNKSAVKSSVGSLASAGSAKTGDEAPIVILFVFMIMSLLGASVLFISGHKKKDNN